MKNQSKCAQRIAIYTRNTTDIQPDGYSIHKDTQILKKIVEDQGYEVSKIYYEPSAVRVKSFIDRPVLKRVIEYAEKGLFSSVLVWDLLTLSSKGNELRNFERDLSERDVNLLSATEKVNTSSEHGAKIFRCVSNGN